MHKIKDVSYSNVNITNGFWQNRQCINAETTAQVIYDRFSDTHRFEALECKWKSGMPDCPDIFWDSDVAKWIEGVAYILSNRENKHLEDLCDRAIESIIANQDEKGYFNSHYLVTEQDERFLHRGNHELYCAGHLIEAACAYFAATGKRAFLDAMIKYADYIYDTFFVLQNAAFITCGHPEIELALVRLYEVTGDKKYLQLSKYFLDQRGNNAKDNVSMGDFNQYQAQDHLPLTEQRTAEGHAVRALYLYSAMADIARIYEDKDYSEACRAIFDDIVNKKMYITGGVGSSNIGEAFTIGYDLPNKSSYAETCASIALALFCKRMFDLNPDSRYSDTIERVMYNGIISGISLDGTSFFYENAMESDPTFQHVNTSAKYERHYPILERVKIFSCSCCPPNLIRFIASVAGYFYAYKDKTLFVNQFAASTAELCDCVITQKTVYPTDGNIEIEIKGDYFNTVAIRIPNWCRHFTISKEYTMINGYAYVKVEGNAVITVDFEMNVERMESNLHVQENAGCVAIQRGPVVYCLEGIDNGECLKSIRVDFNHPFELQPSAEYLCPILKTTGFRKKPIDKLYDFSDHSYSETPLTFIPYFAHANRGATEMIVWVQTK